VTAEPPAILLVEDDRFLRRAAEVRLRRAGYTVLTASDGLEALDIARSARVDLVLLDLIMPKMQGFDVLKTLKAEDATRNVPIVVMSNLSQQSDRDQVALDGAEGYLVKANLSLDDLAAEIDRVLGRAAP
jgi:CheY-like chemotaxis protein